MLNNSNPVTLPKSHNPCIHCAAFLIQIRVYGPSPSILPYKYPWMPNLTEAIFCLEKKIFFSAHTLEVELYGTNLYKIGDQFYSKCKASNLKWILNIIDSENFWGSLFWISEKKQFYSFLLSCDQTSHLHFGPHYDYNPFYLIMCHNLWRK